MWTPRLLHKKAWIYREGDGQLSQGTEETKRLGGGCRLCSILNGKAWTVNVLNPEKYLS